VRSFYKILTIELNWFYKELVENREFIPVIEFGNTLKGYFYESKSFGKKDV